VRAHWKEGQACLEWCLLGKTRFTDPFFEQTVQRLMRHPFQHLFRQQTTFDVLEKASVQNPVATPKGFIFHLSRCGSTLLGQLLAGFPENMVLSEPPPLDFVLRSHYIKPELTRSQRIDWLRGMIRCFGQQPAGAETNLFIKFDAWHIHELPLIREAFPDVPWIFLYRDPVEVLVSHAKQPGAWTIPGMMHPAMLQADPSDWIPGHQEEYCAKILAKICHDGLRYSRENGGLLLNYEELPEVMGTRLANAFCLRQDDNALKQMREIACFDAKTPSFYFEKDSETKQNSASEKLRLLATQYLGPIYQELETERQTIARLRKKQAVDLGVGWNRDFADGLNEAFIERKLSILTLTTGKKVPKFRGGQAASFREDG